jgi:hypothetical protein
MWKVKNDRKKYNDFWLRKLLVLTLSLCNLEVCGNPNTSGLFYLAHTLTNKNCRFFKNFQVLYWAFKESFKWVEVEFKRNYTCLGNFLVRVLHDPLKYNFSKFTSWSISYHRNEITRRVLCLAESLTNPASFCGIFWDLGDMNLTIMLSAVLPLFGD